MWMRRHSQNLVRVGAQLVLTCVLFVTSAATASLTTTTLTEPPNRKEPAQETSRQPLSPLDLIPAPWKSGEGLTLAILDPSGRETGTLCYTAWLTEADGVPAWEIRGEQFLHPTSATLETRVVAHRDTFIPITGYTKNSETGEFRADYSEKAVRLAVNDDASSQTKRIALDRTAYDNEQALFLIRRLPLRENYKASFTIFPVQSGTPVECSVEVMGKEKVETLLGDFECFAVKVQIRAQGAIMLEHHLRVSDDANRYLVRYDTGADAMELVAVEERDKKAGGTRSYTDAEYGVRVRMPSEWKGRYWQSLNREVRWALQLKPLAGPPLVAFFSLRGRGPHITNAAEALDESVGMARRTFRSYVVREDSRRERTVAGLPAASMVADFKGNVIAPDNRPEREEPDRPMVEYRINALGPKYIYRFTLRTERDDFDKVKQDFDKVVDMLEILPGSDGQKASTPRPPKGAPIRH
jgi:hypothetical protein